MKKLLMAVIAALALAACSSTDKKEEPAPVSDRSTPPATTGTTATTTTPTTSTPISVNPLKDPKNILSTRLIYFDFDSNVVKDEYRAMIQAHAKYLTENRSVGLRIEGHTDERGSREYNIALGNRRAESVKKILVVLGVQEGRIEIISFGEEKPVESGHDEASWAKNRRAELKYKGE
jgi:peptidoglycan-associated lipoprotein